MIDTQRQRLKQGRVRSMLARKLGYSVDEVLKHVLENEMYETLGTRMSQMANVQAKRTGNSIYFAHKDLFQNKGQAQQLAVSYYNGHWGAAMKKALEQRRYYKTPHGDVLFLPRAHNIHIGEDGGVYFFNVGDTSYTWHFMDELYYDIHGNAYDPHGEVIVGSMTPRYIKEAHKKLLEIRLRYPKAKIHLNYEDGIKQAIIAIDHSDTHTTIFGGSGMGFNTENYPEPHGIGAYTPVVGSLWSATHDFQDGDYGWAGVNTIMAISDVFLIKSIYTGISKGGLRVVSKNYSNWSSYRRFYGNNGFAESEQHIHHWLWKRNGVKKGSGLRWKLKNQMWNLNPLPKKFYKQGYDWNQIHRAIEGRTSPLPLNALERFYYSTPKYIYPLGVSTLGRTIYPFRE